MRALLVLVLVVILVGAGLKLAGVPLPFIDYAVGPMGEGRGPGMPDVVIEAPGFGDSDQLP
ncbi:MAG TPA: hypothetical protein VHR55_12845 [Candidatus Limnocylindria bacterium]|nr:hypothetical protein [Candidatus Limnocylindria bacterium]